jgi:hypothetical protein
MVTMAFLAEIRQRMRITDKDFDGELKDLIEAARAELQLAGIAAKQANNERDMLITAAIVTYVKSEFGLDVAEAEKYRAAFETKRQKLAMASKYLGGKGGRGGCTGKA